MEPYDEPEVDWLSEQTIESATICRQTPYLSNKPTVYFLDLSDTDVGDEWLFLEKVIAQLPPTPVRPHFVILDSVAGLETISGHVDALGQPVGAEQRINRLVKAAAKRPALAFTAALSPNEHPSSREEGQSDYLYRITLDPEESEPSRFIQVAKARGVRHSLGRHLLDLRSGQGTYSSETWDKDNKRWPEPDEPKRDPSENTAGAASPAAVKPAATARDRRRRGG